VGLSSILGFFDFIGSVQTDYSATIHVLLAIKFGELDGCGSLSVSVLRSFSVSIFTEGG